MKRKILAILGAMVIGVVMAAQPVSARPMTQEVIFSEGDADSSTSTSMSSGANENPDDGEINSTGSGATYCGGTIMGFKPWYWGMCNDGVVDLELSSNKDENPDKLIKGVWKIVLNVLFDVILAVGYIALGYIIYGGYLYIMAQGDPVKVAKGKKTLISAITGTIIALGATVIVNTLTTILGVDTNTGMVQADITRARLDNVFNWAYAMAGIVAVIFIIKAGIEMMLAQGDPGKLAKAKHGILYAVVGLVIVILAAIITGALIGAIGGAL